MGGETGMNERTKKGHSHCWERRKGVIIGLENSVHQVHPEPQKHDGNSGVEVLPKLPVMISVLGSFKDSSIAKV